LLWRDSDMIDVFPMQVCNFSTSWEFSELLDRSNTDYLFHIIRSPDGDWITPIPISWETPVLCILQPIVESPLLDKCGNPARVLVVSQKLFLDISYLDEPCIECPVNKRCLRSPAVGILMDLSTGNDESSSGFQILFNIFVSFFNILTSKIWDKASKVTIKVYWNWSVARFD
jgi:hypothetical protein